MTSTSFRPLLLLLLLTPLLSTAVAGLHAQQVPSSLDGQRVRVYLTEQPSEMDGDPPPQMLLGTVVTVSPDSVALLVHPAARPIVLANRGIERIDVSEGLRSRLESSVRAGFWDAVSFAGQTYVAYSLFDSHVFESRWHALAIGGGVGAVIGLVRGALRPQEHWRRVDER